MTQANTPQDSAPSVPAPPIMPQAPVAKPQITFEDFAKVDLRVAKIIEARPHLNADKLFVLVLDDGSGTPRQICAGIRQSYTAESLVGKSIIVVANLAPRVLRGEESRGMLLAASDMPKDAPGERRVVILSPLGDVEPGAIVS